MGNDNKNFRGIVMPTNIDVTPEGGLSLQGLDRGQVIFNAVYWDKVVCPMDALIKSGFPDEETLIAEKVVERPMLQLDLTSGRGAEIAHSIVRAQLGEVERLNTQLPGQWAMGQTPLAKLVAAQEFVKERGLLIELQGALPAPHADTPIDKVLNFKRKRLPELRRLRAALEDIYLTVAKSPDEEIALRRAVEEIDKSCADLMKSSREDWKAAKPADLKSIAEYGLAFAVPYFTQFGITLSMPQTAIATAAIAGFKIARDIGNKRKTDRKNPYWFAVDLKREGLAS